MGEYVQFSYQTLNRIVQPKWSEHDCQALKRTKKHHKTVVKLGHMTYMLFHKSFNRFVWRTNWIFSGNFCDSMSLWQWFLKQIIYSNLWAIELTQKNDSVEFWDSALMVYLWAHLWNIKMWHFCWHHKHVHEMASPQNCKYTSSAQTLWSGCCCSQVKFSMEQKLFISSLLWRI